MRGTVIHGVLERIQETNELAAILEETIGGLDEPELEELMATGTEYRQELEQEIRRVIQSGEWAWYVQGEHHRELEFAHLAEPRDWRIGAFDLYRPGEEESWVVDFKTHRIEAGEVRKVAEEYAIQARVYAGAAALRSVATVRFHFTHPNLVVDEEVETGGEG